MSGDDIRQAVREKYGDAALRVLAGREAAAVATPSQRISTMRPR